MYKYEMEIAAREKEMLDCLARGIFSLATEQDREVVECMFFLSGLSANGRQGYKNHYKLTENGLERVTTRHWEPQATRLENPYLNTDERIPGLYFIGCVGFNPVTEEYQYCVKVGQSSDIGERMRQHAGSNPLLYHNHASLPLKGKGMTESERNCHRFLDSLAIGMPTGSNEWWFVPKTTYMKLCNIFSEESNFASIARGEF